MEEKKGFVVKDRRGEEKEEQQPNNTTEETTNTSQQPPANTTTEEQPEVGFANFIISLGTTALFHLGMFPDPETQEIKKNLPAAKQVIDIIAMLQEKTKGNLDEEETAIIKESLYNLRVAYLKVTKEEK